MGPIRSDRLLGAISGMVVWAAYFLVVYVAQAIGCDLGWGRVPVAGTNALTVTLAAVTLLSLALIAWTAWIGWTGVRAARRTESEADYRRRFLALTMLAVSVLAFIATAMVGLPILMLHPCLM